VRLRDVQLEGETLGETFKRLSPQLYLSNTTQPVLPAKRLLVSDQVQARIDSFRPQPYIPDFDVLTSSSTGYAAGKYCNFDLMNYSSPTNEFLHVDYAYTDIFPGSVVKSMYLQGVLAGTDSQVPVPAGNNLKQPRISLFDQLNVQDITDSYDSTTLSRRISGAIGLAMSQNKDYTIYFEMGTSDDVADFANRVNFNGALLKKLGLYRQAGVPLAAFQKKIIFLFTKPIGTFDVRIKSP
jgi:hypothetical protein